MRTNIGFVRSAAGLVGSNLGLGIDHVETFVPGKQALPVAGPPFAALKPLNWFRATNGEAKLLPSMQPAGKPMATNASAFIFVVLAVFAAIAASKAEGPPTTLNKVSFGLTKMSG